jgi:3-isopropylmalate/(R)-2-methylmalate dehydratase large subunit
MGYTITEKILLRHAKEKKIAPGDFIFARVDLALGNDITAPLAVEEFRKAGASRVINNKRVVFTLDHFTPSKDIKSAAQCKLLREFAREQRFRNFFDIGTGIEHALLPEKGLVGPGDLVIGADSHTCTYGALGAFASGVGSTDLAAAMITGKVWLRVPESMKLIYYGKLPKWTGGKDIILRTIKDLGVDGARYKAMEFCGEAIENLPMEGRFTVCNMAIEAGAKNGIIAPDKTTLRYAKERKVKVRKWDYSSDPDAGYSETREYDVSK